MADENVWEQRYANASSVWSGRVNAFVEDTVGEMKAGSALDLGCGEGDDAIWMARSGWKVLGLDIAPTAIRRAQNAALANGVEGETRFVISDLSDLMEVVGDQRFDLVTATFLQSPVALEREVILRSALRVVAPGGSLLLISHARPHPWSFSNRNPGAPGSRGPRYYPQPEDELASLALVDPCFEEDFEVVEARVRTRDVLDPEGSPAQMLDTVVLVRRHSVGIAD